MPETLLGAALAWLVAGFHRRFYHRVPIEAQLDALLGEPGVLPR